MFSHGQMLLVAAVIAAFPIHAVCFFARHYVYDMRYYWDKLFADSAFAEPLLAVSDSVTELNLALYGTYHKACVELSSDAGCTSQECNVPFLREIVPGMINSEWMHKLSAAAALLTKTTGGQQLVPDIGSLASEVPNLAKNLVFVLRALIEDPQGEDSACVRQANFIEVLYSFASISHFGASKLHLLQMHVEGERWQLTSRHHRLEFHSNLGRHRYSIIPQLALQQRAQRYLEVGVMHGDCADAVLSAMPEIHIHLVDPFEDATDEYFEQVKPWNMTPALQLSRGVKVRDRFRDEPNVTIWQMTSRSAARLLRTDGLFDFVFIDGDHSYLETLFDLRAWVPRVRRGGIVAVHDYSGDCVRCEYEVVRAIHTFLPAGYTLHTSPDVLAWFEVS